MVAALFVYWMDRGGRTSRLKPQRRRRNGLSFKEFEETNFHGV